MSASTVDRDARPADDSFALAIAVLRERVSRLSREDQNDLYELLPALLGSDEEERESARLAVAEILDQRTGSVQTMPLPASPAESLKKWVAYVSGRIREARQNADMTQQQLAQKSGLEQAHISRLESGQHSPTSLTLEKIASALGVDVSYFDPSA